MSKLTEDVKNLLTGTIDDKLEIIERRTEERLASLLGVSAIPQEFEYILYEVTLKRFNRIGQEGMQSYTQEGLSMAFPDSDFAEYQQVINEFKDQDKGLLGPKKGGFRFV